MSGERDQRPYNVAYYEAHRDEEISRVRARQHAAVELLRILRDVPCLDCGNRFPSHVMDFDHTRGSRSFWLLQRAGSVSQERLIAELEKCEVVCANCHRARTNLRALERRRLRAKSGHVPIIESRRRREQTAMMQKLREVPCVDCKQRFPFFAMDFDHRHSAQKSFEVTRMLGRLATERLLEEVAKCDIVCANCHRDRTYRRRAAHAGVA